jgi:hypothetical protein
MKPELGRSRRFRRRIVTEIVPGVTTDSVIIHWALWSHVSRSTRLMYVKVGGGQNTIPLSSSARESFHAFGGKRGQDHYELTL